MPQVVIFSSNEVGPEVATKVKAALVKSKDSRKELINVIMSVIRERDTDDIIKDPETAHIELPPVEDVSPLSDAAGKQD